MPESQQQDSSHEPDTFPSTKHRFKPGQSGNPKGGPKGKRLKTRIRELLAAIPPDHIRAAADKIGLAENPDAMDLMILAMIKKSWEGDVGSARFLAEYTDGKPAQRVDASLDGSLRISLEKDEFDV